MLDIGFQEFILVAFVLLIVVGPKDLPKVLKSITSSIRKLKSMASQFHSGIDDLANEAELSDLRKEVVNLDEKKIITQEMKNLKEFQNNEDFQIDNLKKDIDEIKNIDVKKKIKNIKYNLRDYFG